MQKKKKFEKKYQMHFWPNVIDWNIRFVPTIHFLYWRRGKKIPFLSFIRNIFNGLSRVLASKLHLHIFNLAEEKKSVSSFIIAKFYFHITYAERKDLFTFIKTLSILRKFKSNRFIFDGAKNFAFLTEIS